MNTSWETSSFSHCLSFFSPPSHSSIPTNPRPVETLQPHSGPHYFPSATSCVRSVSVIATGETNSPIHCGYATQISIHKNRTTTTPPLPTRQQQKVGLGTRLSSGHLDPIIGPPPSRPTSYNTGVYHKIRTRSGRVALPRSPPVVYVSSGGPPAPSKLQPRRDAQALPSSRPERAYLNIVRVSLVTAASFSPSIIEEGRKC